jgi:HAD superfamily hydrolase (TIGR01509 family)
LVKTNIKLIIFDLDGVLVDIKNIHFDALNLALDNKYKISHEEHICLYDGLKTKQKLHMLTNKKGLPINQHEYIWNKKQEYTLNLLNTINPRKDLIYTIKNLKQNGFKLAVCSNSIYNTIYRVLSKLEIINFFDLILSNEDVQNAKPHPEIYWKAISKLSCLPEETLIIEDSPYGLLAASRSNSHVMRVKASNEVTYTNIINYINTMKTFKTLLVPKWKDPKLNILIPMAGAGSRFEKAGYTFPKPLIEVRGKPMIQLVVENLNIDANYIFIIRKDHRKKYHLDSFLNLITPNCKIIEVDKITEGAACTSLLAKKYIDNNSPLFFANSDQFVEWNSNDFMYRMNETNVDGGIVTFEAVHPKWSFAKVNEFGFVTEVAEKNPISNKATVGFYWWKNGSDFVKYAEQMIKKNTRVNNEFYVCPVFNEAIDDNKKILNFNIENMWGLGTPEDLNFFIENYGS